MTGCGAGEACIHDDVYPNLSDPVPAPDGYRAFATCHPDATRSLSVSWRDGRIQWNCFACKDRLGNEEAQRRTRNALIRCGVPAGCLPQPRKEAEAQLEAIREVVFGKGKHAHRLFRIAAMLSGWDELPAGEDLEALADLCSVAHSTAYEARRGAHTR